MTDEQAFKKRHSALPERREDGRSDRQRLYFPGFFTAGKHILTLVAEGDKVCKRNRSASVSVEDLGEVQESSRLRSIQLTLC